MFLINSRYHLFTAANPSSDSKCLSPKLACLLPKLRHHFAEFLNKSSPNRLRILIPSTCVGLGYGLIFNSLRSFSWKQRITNFSQRDRHYVSGFTLCGFAYTTPYALKPGQPNARISYLSPSLLQSNTKYQAWEY